MRIDGKVRGDRLGEEKGKGGGQKIDEIDWEGWERKGGLERGKRKGRLKD